MPLNPGIWTVVVIGGWNRAILTPFGILTRLFDMPGSNVEANVEVPLDAIGPFRVHQSNLVVMAGNNSLIIEVADRNYDGLARGMAVAKRAVDTLPETPVIAAGFNIRYESEEMIQCLWDATRSELWDDRILAAGHSMSSRTIARAIPWKEGKILVNLETQDPSTAKLDFNFERRGNRIELMEWLGRPIAEVREQVECILLNVIRLTGDQVHA